MRAGSLTVGGAAEREASDRAGPLYAGVGGEAAVWGMVDRFHRLAFADGEVCRFFGVELTGLRWHQAAQLSGALGGPDWYRAAGCAPVYPPLVVAPMVRHRLAFYLVRAVDTVGSRVAVLAVATGLAAGTCRIVGGFAVGGMPTVAAVEAAW